MTSERPSSTEQPHDPVGPDDETWLAVLSGNTAPASRSARQAEALREYFKLQAKHEEPLSEAAQRRLLNMLEARGVFNGEKRARDEAPAQRDGGSETVAVVTRFTDRLREWLFSGYTKSWNLTGAVAMLVLAVVFTPFWLSQVPQGDDGSEIKSLPSGSTEPSSIIESSRPSQSAEQLRQLLARQGVIAQVYRDGEDQWVIAEVPQDRRGDVQTALVNIGLAMNPDGHLSVMYRKQRGS